MKMSYVNNIPEYAYEYKWWVVTKVDGEYWFFGAYTTEQRAIEVVNLENAHCPQFHRETAYNWDYIG